MASIKDLATELDAAFVGTTRPDGESYLHLREGSPEWMTEVVHAAHGDMLPEDIRYAMIQQCANAIAECDDEDGEGADDSLEADVYTSDLTGWLHSSNGRYAYVDEAVSEFGHGESLTDDLMMGQLQEKRETFGLLLEALREQVEASEAQA